MLGHLWSVAVEEQFYLIWPVCVLFMSRAWLGFLTAALACVMLLLRVSYITRFGTADFISYLPITHADGLALGALAAVLLSKDVSPRYIRLASIGCIAVLGLFLDGTLAYCAHPLEFSQTIGFSLLALGFAAGVFAVAATRSRNAVIRGLETRWLTNAGKYSFGIYLFHVPLLEGFRQIVLRIGPLWSGNFVVASLRYGQSHTTLRNSVLKPLKPRFSA
jgi:peptidoglycan/LPS O-acetylase OafA/YrhL